MRYVALFPDNKNSVSSNDLNLKRKSGHVVGPVTVSDEYLFVKRYFRYYYISYNDADKIFRRVRSLHANICCGDGDIEVEYLVICAGGREILEITLPGKKAAKMLMEELKQIRPELDTSAPVKEKSENEADE